MADAIKSEIRSNIVKMVEPSINQVASDIVKNYVKNSPEFARLRVLENYNFQPHVINANTLATRDNKGTFIWGKSTWGIDSVSVERLVRDGEYDPSTRSGVVLRDEFRPQ